MNKKALTAVALGTAAVAAPLLLRRRDGRGGVIATSFLIERPADEVWRAWRRLEDLPQNLAHVERVETLDDRRSHWTAVAARLQPLTRRALREDLRRFKGRMEAGEAPRVAGQPTGERSTLDPTNPF